MRHIKEMSQEMKRLNSLMKALRVAKAANDVSAAINELEEMAEYAGNLKDLIMQDLNALESEL